MQSSGNWPAGSFAGGPVTSLKGCGHRWPACRRQGCFASSWELDGVRLWTLVNRNRQPVSGIRVSIEAPTACEPLAGRELAVNDHEVAIDIPAAGLGAVVEETVESDFLEDQADRHRQLVSASYKSSRLVPRARTRPGIRGSVQAPDGMVHATGGVYVRRTRFRLRECGMYEGARAGESADLVLPGLHSMVAMEFREELSPYAIDRHSVTVAAFRRFVEETGYSPDTPGFFGEPGAGPHEPVTRVDPDDARAYASWLGRRLPTESEWQRAAEDGLLNDDPVRVWNWTEPEMSDGRTRFCIVKGGSHHHLAASDWYADGGVRDASFAAKYLLMWPGLDRCSTIGFRTAIDLLVPPQAT